MSGLFGQPLTEIFSGCGYSTGAIFLLQHKGVTILERLSWGCISYGVKSPYDTGAVEGLAVGTSLNSRTNTPTQQTVYSQPLAAIKSQ